MARSAPFRCARRGRRAWPCAGFAVVSTDSGHQGAVFDTSFMKDQEAAINFASASVGKVTIAAKAIIASYYGQPVKRSYFAGCSTGGREGMLASSRHAGEFDGVVSGAPAMRTRHSNLGLAWANVAFNEIAPKDDAGKPDPTKVFSAHRQEAGDGRNPGRLRCQGWSQGQHHLRHQGVSVRPCRPDLQRREE